MGRGENIRKVTGIQTMPRLTDMGRGGNIKEGAPIQTILTPTDMDRGRDIRKEAGIMSHPMNNRHGRPKPRIHLRPKRGYGTFS